jgi:putative copper export protein
MKGGSVSAEVAAVMGTSLRVVSVVAACGTVGSLAVALVVVPTWHQPSCTGGPTGHLRSATRWAVLWAAASLLWAALTLAGPVAAGHVVHPAPGDDGTILADVARTAVITAWAASVVTVLGRNGSQRSARAAFVVALAGVVGMVLSGHSIHAENWVWAVSSMALHVSGAAVWVGGLLALAMQSVSTPPSAAEVRRFSGLALGCYLVVGASGVANLASRLTPAELLDSGAYVALLGAKTAVFVALGLAGAAHRARTVRSLAAGRPRAFLLLVVVELLLMATAAGFAVALAGTGA